MTARRRVRAAGRLAATLALSALAYLAAAAAVLAALRWAGVPTYPTRGAATLAGVMTALVVLLGRLRPPERCACGRRLHYSSPATEQAMRQVVGQLGERARVTTPDGTFLVPRHYVALHGLAADELPRLGFPKVAP
jgi:hypothetical protein